MEEREKNALLMEQQADQEWAKDMDQILAHGMAHELLLICGLELRKMKKQGMIIGALLMTHSMRRILITAVRKGLIPPQDLNPSSFKDGWEQINKSLDELEGEGL